MKYASLFSLFCLLAGTALSADEMRPATFDHPEEKERLGTRIEFPEVSKDMSTMIHCYSQISARGKMKESGCYQRNNPDMPFLVATLKAAKKATLTPAIINGKARSIYLQFRVEFVAEGESRNIHFYLNPGYAENVEAYGYDHVAAQRVIGKESWQDVCPKRAGYLLLVRAFVGEDGRLFRRHGKIPGRRIMLDVPARGLRGQPFAHVSFRGPGLLGEIVRAERSVSSQRLIQTQLFAEHDERGTCSRPHVADHFS